MSKHYSSVFALALLSPHVAQAGVEELMRHTQFEGRQMNTSRERVPGQLEQVMEQLRRSWQASGPVRESILPGWSVLSRPHAHGLEVVQMRQDHAHVEMLRSVLPLESQRLAASVRAKEELQLFQALELQSVAPVLSHEDAGRRALSGAAQLQLAPEAAFELVRVKLQGQNWVVEFGRFLPGKGGVLLLKGPKGERVNATLHAHQGGTALVAQESK
jgi:hypothetical protein